MKYLILFILIILSSCGISLKVSSYNNLNENEKKIIIPYNSKLINKKIEYKSKGDTIVNCYFQMLTFNNLLDIVKKYDTTHLLLVQPFCSATDENISNFKSIAESSNSIKIFLATTYDIYYIHTIGSTNKLDKPFYIIDTVYGKGNYKPQKKFTKSLLALNNEINVKEANYFKITNEGKLIDAKWAIKL